MSEPNRIVLVHNGRRLFDQTGVCVEMLAQDEGQTLKVFVTDMPESEKARAAARHRERFAESLRGLWGKR